MNSSLKFIFSNRQALIWFLSQKINYIIKFDSCMDNSDYDSENNRAILEIQRAQRILDQTESKIRKLKKDKQSSSKLTTNINYTSPLPDIKQYITCLLSCENDGSQYNNKDYQTTIFQNGSRKNGLTQAPSKKTQKSQFLDIKNNNRQVASAVQSALKFDLKYHTQEQLEKSQVVHIDRIQAIYNEELAALDAKTNELIKDREKIKRDKVLLLRDNQQIEKKIEDLRVNKPNTQGQPSIITQLQSELIKLQRRLDKIEAQNKKIIKRKQQLQTNMRVCIRNSKDELETNIAKSQLRSNKSKSHIIHRCDYH